MIQGIDIVCFFRQKDTFMYKDTLDILFVSFIDLLSQIGGKKYKLCSKICIDLNIISVGISFIFILSLVDYVVNLICKLN